ncbi:hypothetical protein BCV69DRAFT_153317 [Microstroma glucosiphilum]|uniref:RING-type E3 ubiquitin transferase n=1 Tax=Pseudomicrostroma glucosiphilum TaxID=1684307 RepID=A0A316U904_9BASI|nr:hypothetical protein BCV69DRAFT_153317 [Pseudomicrostroma glucosiphilum]PWN21740.1 hypothetical protein BCV69DRAFT_153317 [Pseudomicrostroma glucosiphilum]
MPQAVSPLFTPQRLVFYGAASVAAAGGVIVRAFRERSNFYAAAVWLGRSNGCMLVLLNFGVFITLIFGKVCQAIFFGSLRPTEVEHLYERSWYAVTETLLAMTIFRDEFDGSFVVLFGTLLFLKVFHWLCADRVELMEQSPSVSRLFHARMISVLWTLFCLDLFLVAFAIEVLVLEKQRMGIMIMFASEFMILTATLWATIAKYIINCQDMRSDEPWEAKSMYVSAVDLVTDFLKLATYVCFFCLILTYYGLPLNIVRDVYVTARSFFGRIRDLIRYRAATRNMDTRFPNATHEDLRRTDGTCIICRDEMVARGPDPTLADPQDGVAGPEAGGSEDRPTHAAGSGDGPNDTPKKLACGHIFHFHCLRAWLERQQSCPTCRRTVFETTPAPMAAAAAPVAEVAPQPPAQENGQAHGPAASVARPPGVPTPTSTAAQIPASRGAHRLPARHGSAGNSSPLGDPNRGRQHLQGLLNQVLGVDSPHRPSSPLRTTMTADELSSREMQRRGTDDQPRAALSSSRSSYSMPSSSNGARRRSSWMPPPPSSLQVPSNLDLPELALPLPPRQPARSSIDHGGEAAGASTKGTDAEDDTNEDNDPQDPRDAARQAALRRFGLPPSAANATTGAVPRSSDGLLRVPTATWPSSHHPSPLDLMDAQAEISDEDLDTPLTPAEFDRLALQTRRGIQEQLRVVQRAQSSLWKVSVELNRALSVIPGSGSPQSGGAVEIESSSEEEGDSGELKVDKGKAKAAGSDFEAPRSPSAVTITEHSQTEESTV